MPGRVPTSERGFTLIEVLVALVVLSIGLLGVAKLVMAAVHADDSAYMRSQATQLAYEMLDEMRANRQAALNGDYGLSPAAANCLTATCSAQQIAQANLYDWRVRLAKALPAGSGTVTTAVGVNDEMLATVTVQWNDSLAQWAFGTASTATPSQMSLTLSSIL